MEKIRIRDREKHPGSVTLSATLISSAFELILFFLSVYREMTSRLLSDLFQKVVSQRDIGKSFDYLIRQLGDLVLDTPEAALILG